jgi:hypothetical protein
LSVSLAFVDQSKDQIDMIKRFFEKRVTASIADVFRSLIYASFSIAQTLSFLRS